MIRGEQVHSTSGKLMPQHAAIWIMASCCGFTDTLQMSAKAFRRLQLVSAQWKGGTWYGKEFSRLSFFLFFFLLRGASRVLHCEHGAQYPPCLFPVKHITPRCRGACTVGIGDLAWRGSFHATEAFCEAGFFSPPFLFENQKLDTSWRGVVDSPSWVSVMMFFLVKDAHIVSLTFCLFSRLDYCGVAALWFQIIADSRLKISFSVSEASTDT